MSLGTSYRRDTEFSRHRGIPDIGQACTIQAQSMSTRPSATGRHPGHEYCFAMAFRPSSEMPRERHSRD
jgi:hypothetical protein